MIRRLIAQIAWRVFSVPIFVKILGIGLAVTVLFGGVAFYQIRVGMYYTHYQVHGETALSIARALAALLDTLLAEGQIEEVDHEIEVTMKAFPDLRYVIVQNKEGQIVSHGFTFPQEAPADLASKGRDLCAGCHPSISPKEVPASMLEIPSKLAASGTLRVYTRRAGLVLDVVAPIGDGSRGSVRLGVGDTVIARELRTITRSLFWSLALCAAVGLSLALVLAYMLVQPVHNLVQATRRIRGGDFKARAHVFSEDEVGGLASAFNEMAESLDEYREEVREKERVRVKLIARTVQAQEDERKLVARELHDQLGQALSNVLLTIESECHDCVAHKEGRERVTQEIRASIDQVRRLAWDVRPSILDDYGLDLALARYIDDVSSRVGFALDYQCVAPPEMARLPDVIEVTLYRIAQEAVTNVIRHAAATQASVILLRRDQEVSLIVEDNGRGFSVKQAERGTPPPLGLMGMQERAALVAGTLTVDSSPGKGATVRVVINLGEAGIHGDSDTDS